MMRLVGGATVVAVAVMLFPVAVQAQTPGLANARVEISAAVAGSSATLEALERQANARDRARQEEIAALQTRLTEAEARGASEVARLQAELISAREALVADLASRDRAYAEEIAVFRREVTSIASTSEGAAALARYNAGDRVGAITVLDRLIEVRDVSRQTRANLEGADERRQIAALALDARGKGDPAFDTGRVISRYEAVIRLDPGGYGDWYQLVQLYIAAGRRADGLAAAERLEALAANDWDRSVALGYIADLLLTQGDRDGALSRYQRGLEIVERLSAAEPASAPLARAVSVMQERIGDVLLSQGDRDGGLLRYQRSLEIAERLSRADPASAALRGAVSVALSKVGDVLLSQGDRDGALARYQRGLGIFEHLSAANPTSVALARDVSVSLDRIGDLLLSQGDRDSALSRYQRSLEVRERLSAADPASAALARDVSVSLDKIGDVLLSEGKHDGALSRYQHGLEIRERLYAADPASIALARDVSVSLSNIGYVLLSEGDSDGALARYQRSVEIFERLLAADPLSADLARDLFISLWRIADVTDDRSVWERALAILKNLKAEGKLPDADLRFIVQIETTLSRPVRQ